jgi:hypothetical protein
VKGTAVFHTRTVVIAACDLCGNTQTEDGDTWHFDTETQAIDQLTADPTADINGWHQRPTGQLVCWRRDPLHNWAREQDGIHRPGPDAMTATWN